ncbi:MAG: hydratase [Lachnospiraceae bacterium]|nr:hydratase [Lachnospiraceae bacterium]
MIELRKEPVILRNGIPVDAEKATEEGRKMTIAARILSAHNTSEEDGKLKIRFDALVSHDITYVGIIQTARASGLKKFPIPYVLTNCHNSLCAVGGTINEDDHVFGLSAARKYGGIYVPPHQAVIHQYAREMMAKGGAMILGSDSHTRYGALGTMAVGEGGPELVKQLLNQTYDIDTPPVTAVYLKGEVPHGTGPQDVALALIAAVFESGFVKNSILEFIGPGVSGLSADFRIGVDVMTTETTCLSSIWQTDDVIRRFYEVHGREGDYRELLPEDGACYDKAVIIDLSEIRPMIALPFHPSLAVSIREFKENMQYYVHETEERARVSFGENVRFSLREKIHGRDFQTDQGIIAGCAGGGFENICAASDILRGRYTGKDAFTLSVYPASMPVYMELVKNGCAADLMESGAVMKTAFCGPCFGAGDTPANGAFSIRHSTRNFPNREGSRIQDGQLSSVALMDARSIAATAARGGVLTGADEEDISFGVYEYHFDRKIYENRVFDQALSPDPSAELVMGPNIRDWPDIEPLNENLLINIVSEIHDPVTTTDELIPSGETSSYRSNPLKLAEFALSRKDPEYVGRAKEIQALEKGRLDGDVSGIGVIFRTISDICPCTAEDTEIGSAVFAVKPGDGSAREQAASCQRVLGGIANLATEYATKRYRSNLINWGMLPFTISTGENGLPFKKLDWIFVPGIRKAVEQGETSVKAYALTSQGTVPFELSMGELTPDERKIILAGCLINYNRELSGN